MKLIKILNEFLIEDYPTTWDWEEFGKLTKFSERKKYCDEHLEFLIQGSGRLVYKVDDDKVLKLAKNTKGVAQCNVEIRLGNDRYIDHTVAPIYEYDSDGYWVEMALATKLSKGKFKSIIGYSFDDYGQMLMLFYYRNIKPSKYGGHAAIDDENERNKIEEDEFFQSMCDMMGSYDMPPGDLRRLNSYGLVKINGKEEIRLIDYGLTNNVYEDYYK